MPWHQRIRCRPEWVHTQCGGCGNQNCWSCCTAQFLWVLAACATGRDALRHVGVIGSRLAACSPCARYATARFITLSQSFLVVAFCVDDGLGAAREAYSELHIISSKDSSCSALPPGPRLTGAGGERGEGLPLRSANLQGVWSGLALPIIDKIIITFSLADVAATVIAPSRTRHPHGHCKSPGCTAARAQGRSISSSPLMFVRDSHRGASYLLHGL